MTTSRGSQLIKVFFLVFLNPVRDTNVNIARISAHLDIGHCTTAIDAVAQRQRPSYQQVSPMAECPPPECPVPGQVSRVPTWARAA